MKVAERIASRQEQWTRLEALLDSLRQTRLRRLPAETMLEFGRLHRNACADLALAEAYRLPDATVRYLNELVARSHNALYRSQQFQLSRWGQILFIDLPRRLLRDPCVWLGLGFFWMCFLASMAAAYLDPSFARQIVGEDQLSEFEGMYAESFASRSADPKEFGESRSAMAGFYIWHNAGIGLRCFASGIFLGVGSLGMLAFNGVFLGTVFGHMAQTPMSATFLEFVTAHAPFELTAIGLAGGAGLRMGLGFLHTGGLARGDSFRREARRAFEVAALATLLFIAAAFIEGFLSPSSQPWSIKAFVALLSAGTLVAYWFGLGWPRPVEREDLEERADSWKREASRRVL